MSTRIGMSIRKERIQRIMKTHTVALGLLLALVGCGTESGGSAGNGGATSTGGQSATPGNGGKANGAGGTTGNGGGTASGGTSVGVGGSSMGGQIAVTSGGTTASGGAAQGGAPGNGGLNGSGGKVTSANGGAAQGGSQSSQGGTSSGTGGTAASRGGSSATGGANASGGTAGASSTGATMHIFLLLGQSNMAGYPKAVDADKVKNQRIKVLGVDDCAATGRKADQWDVAVPPLHECWNGALGPGDYFSKTLIDKIPANDTIGLVPCALSGQAIEVMMKGGSKWDWILNRAKAAQKLGPIEGFLFHQGESNCGDSAWPGKVKTFVSDLRSGLGLGNVPFLAGELAYSPGKCSQHNPLVNQLPGLITNGFVVSASGLKLDPADTTYYVHFDHDSQVEFGKRYEAKMVSALGW